MRHPPRRLHLPLQARRGPSGAARRDDPARAGPHVVRGHGYHDLVERPMAQRVLRRVHLHSGHRRDHSLEPGLDDLPDPGEGVGLQPGPAVLHPPRGRGDPRPARRRGQLRRHHLRQGGLSPGRARGLRGQGELLRRHPALPGGARLRQRRAERPAPRAGGGLGTRPEYLDPPVAPGGRCDDPAHAAGHRHRRPHHPGDRPPGDPRRLTGLSAPAPGGDRLLQPDRPGSRGTPGTHQPHRARCRR